MRAIPLKMRQDLEDLPRMKYCTLKPLEGVYGACSGRVEWHHVWTYAGRQINETWAILSACHQHHEMVKEQKAIRMAFETASLLLAGDELAKYPKKEWAQIKKSLGMKV